MVVKDIICDVSTKRIVFCVARGRMEFGEMALGLARSLKLINDSTPRVLMTDIEGVPWGRYFDEVVAPPGKRSALDKLFGCDLTDADAVLSLDVDMLAFKRLDPIFEFCQGKPFAVQGFWESTYPFHRRPAKEICEAYGLEAQYPRFNGGMAYYERGDKWSEILAAMRHAEAHYETLGFERFRAGYASEEVCMLDAMLKCQYVELIPDETQFQHSMAGLISKFDLDVLQNRCSATCFVDKLEYAEPTIFHAWRYKDYRLYWNELRKLRRAEETADSRPRGYVSRLSRLQRSIERRWMKNVRKWR